eukprot:6156959-Amphidinium_carterae.1
MSRLSGNTADRRSANPGQQSVSASLFARAANKVGTDEQCRLRAKMATAMVRTTATKLTETLSQSQLRCLVR